MAYTKIKKSLAACPLPVFGRLLLLVTRHRRRHYLREKVISELAALAESEQHHFTFPEEEPGRNSFSKAAKAV